MVVMLCLPFCFALLLCGCIGSDLLTLLGKCLVFENDRISLKSYNASSFFFCLKQCDVGNMHGMN